MGSSLSSSLVISQRLCGSVSEERSRPMAIQFDRRWNHPECQVLKWYKLQSESSTKFTVIEHRRELKAPFHHEYLLIHLEDGAIYRLERTGEGSHQNAIRRVGCKAHDIIQWFAKDDYLNHPLAREPSELVTKIEFPEVFDLLDVLAICYGIQGIEKSSVYTLQRYNCYFLCLTVLSLLARRCANWETVISQDTWINAVNSAIPDLLHEECRDEFEYLGLGVCSLVVPESPEPRRFIVDSLKKELHEHGLGALERRLEGTLWHSDLSVPLYFGMEGTVRSAVDRALSGDDVHAIRMKELIRRDKTLESNAQVASRELPQDVLSSLITELASSLQDSAKSTANTLQMREIEDPTPWRERLSLKLWGVKEFTRFLFGAKRDFILPRINEIEMPRSVRIRLAAMAEMNPSMDDHELRDLSDIKMEHAIYKSMWSTICSPPGQTREQSLTILRALGYDERDWSDDPEGVQMTVARFQEATVRRIYNHAQRVSSIGLAAAPFVESDIKATMTSVWDGSQYFKYYTTESPAHDHEEHDTVPTGETFDDPLTTMN
ncbi:hypothetical protein RHS04_00329 [Rhizoctonia solani]|uniref:Uncharacterized protein n=1 Tax=Rhizoctonia solani TaxID=456999 RepID=A0A8H7LLL3_9AGAM|nr:hypothetical protein RHS04_00329 [Rhizoctonia solani]